MTRKGKNRMAPKVPTAQQQATIEIPKTEFIPHRLDPLLNLAEAGRLIGRSPTCIRKWIDSGILEAVRGHGAINRRVRKSDLIAVSGVAAFARKSPFLYLQEAELPAGYEYDGNTMPSIRVIDQIEYFPVHLSWFKDDQAPGSDT